MASKKQPKPQAVTHDFSWGLYRRIYTCWRKGRRINSVSVNAALLFIHLHTACDDFGNMEGDPAMVAKEAAPRRESFTPTKIKQMLAELAATKPPLVKMYEVDGESYLHIADFTTRQPAGKNGRRVMRFPREPSDFGESELLDSPGRGDLGNPVRSGPAHEHEHEQIPLTPLRRGKGLRPREAAKQQTLAAQDQARHDSSNAYLAKIERLRAEAAKPPGKAGGESPGLPRDAGPVGNGSDAAGDGS